MTAGEPMADRTTFNRLFSQTLARCAKALGEATLSAIRLLDLRRTHAQEHAGALTCDFMARD